jgi:hypothetical protein
MKEKSHQKQGIQNTKFAKETTKVTKETDAAFRFGLPPLMVFFTSNKESILFMRSLPRFTMVEMTVTS